MKDLDASTEVVVYAKLPRGFFIPTPVGNYNPDWAIAFQQGTVKHVYFVAETKGSMSSMDLLARAMVKDPPLLILDEPCQGLDDNHRRAFTRLLDEVCAHTPVAMIYVTHYQDELPAAITHRLVLGQGRIVEKGAVAPL